MEPAAEGPSPYGPGPHSGSSYGSTSPYNSSPYGSLPKSQHPSGPRIADIMSSSDGAQRKLPVPQVPKVAVQDLLIGGGGVHVGTGSGGSSKEGSLSGGDLETRY